jgi:ABC-2 type transport system ATP-binding protein
MIAASGLTRRYGGREAVADVTFSVQPGEVVGFLGPNGAGKSTTMRTLLGLLRPHAGEVHVDGPAGYLPEQFAAYDAVSVRSYLQFMTRMKRVDRGDVDRVLGAAGVADLASRPVARLSKGQRQRVGLAQALLGSPASYVLDEPTQGLDPKQIVEARALIRSLATDAGAAVLLSTHVLAEVAAVCDRVVVIVRGRVVAEEAAAGAADLEARFLRLVGESELS